MAPRPGRMPAPPAAFLPANAFDDVPGAAAPPGLGPDIGSIPYIGGPGAARPANGLGPELGMLQQSPQEVQAENEWLRQRQERAAADQQARAATEEYARTHSRVAEAALWASKGFLDALLAPAALLAAGTEGVATMLGADGAAKFAREVGEASNGTAALQALAMAYGEATAGTGIEDAVRTKKDFETSANAWPLLTTVSDFAGGALFGLASGGMAAGLTGAAEIIGPTTVKQWVLQGAADGAAYGAQWGYDQHAPLSDILVSSGIGLAFGAGFGFLWGSGEKAISGVSAERLAKKAAFKAVVDRQSELAKIAGRKSVAESNDLFERMGGHFLGFQFQRGEHAGETLFLDTSRKVLKTRRPEDMPVMLNLAREELGEELGAMRAALDKRVTGTVLAPDARDLLLTVRRDILAPAEAELAGMAAGTARRDMSEILSRIKPLTDLFEFRGARQGVDGRIESVLLEPSSPVWWRALEQADPGQSRLGFAQLDTWRQQLARDLYPKRIRGVAPPLPESALTLQKLERTLEGYLEDSAEKAFSELGTPGAYTQLKEAYHAFREGVDASRVKDQARLGNNFFSLRDAIGAAAAGAGMLARASTPAALLTSVATAFGTKWLRENSNILLAATMQRMVHATRTSVAGRVSALFAPGLAVKTLGRAVSRFGRPLSKGTIHDYVHDTVLTSIYEERYNDVQAAASVQSGQRVQAALERMPGLPEALVPTVARGMTQRMQQLAADMPKPRYDQWGNATVSREDARIGNARYEATVAPDTVFDDMLSGNVDYDKVTYAWKQNPGLQRAYQAAIIDKLTVQMSPEEREKVPETLLTQLDFVAGFHGALRRTVSTTVALRMAEARAAEEQQRPQGAALELPGAKPTPVGRMMRA